MVKLVDTLASGASDLLDHGSSNLLLGIIGVMAEWFKAHARKACLCFCITRVRISFAPFNIILKYPKYEIKS